MRIQHHVGDAWYVSDEIREDGAQVEQLMTARSMESSRALKKCLKRDISQLLLHLW